jgi:CO/xanthine dehydrogenase Mo-binding subunit
MTAYVDRQVRRQDDLRCLTGRGRYVDDIGRRTDAH